MRGAARGFEDVERDTRAAVRRNDPENAPVFCLRCADGGKVTADVHPFGRSDCPKCAPLWRDYLGGVS